MGRMVTSPTKFTVYAETGDQVFAENAATYQRAGLFVIPVKADKRPCVSGFGRDGYKPGAGAIRRWVKDFPSANIAILTGPSEVTVVDVDDPDQTQLALERFGDTPLQTETPSGGAHMYYRAAGERSANLRREGLDIDIKAGHAYVIAPPSRSENWKEYHFTKGGLETFQSLPTIKPGSLGPANDTKAPVPEGKYGEGERDAFIAPLIREIAYRCETYHATLAEAREANEAHCHPPLPDSEIVAKVKWAWEKKCDGDLHVKGDGRLFAKVDLEDATTLYRYKPALALFVHLKAHHPQRHTFAVPPSREFSKTLRMSPNTLRDARDFLLRHRFIVRIKTGGKGERDPHLYRFGSRSERK